MNIDDLLRDVKRGQAALIQLLQLTKPPQFILRSEPKTKHARPGPTRSEFHHQSIPDRIWDYFAQNRGKMITVYELYAAFPKIHRCSMVKACGTLMDRKRIVRIGRGTYRTTK